MITPYGHIHQIWVSLYTREEPDKGYYLTRGETISVESEEENRITGEIESFAVYGPGKIYVSLKDDGALGDSNWWDLDNIIVQENWLLAFND